MSVCFIRPNEIAEIRLKFFNVNKIEIQISLRLASKQANAIKTYEVYETDNECLRPKLAIYEWIDRLKKQFPKGTDFLLWHKGFNKPTTTKDISLQLTKLLGELKIVGAQVYSIRHSATTELAKLVLTNKTIFSYTQQEQMTQLGNQQVTQVKKMKDQTRYLNREVRQGEKGVTYYYSRLSQSQGNDLLSPYLLISPLAHPKYVSQPEVKQKQGENSQRTEGSNKRNDVEESWSALNEIAEIRTLLCQSLISLIQRIIDKETLSTSCIDEYEEEIDE
ncbi:MAG: hypothetical protein EZS28_016585 [Streblomastix strix]|uniref:Tyr recombinase domain-containing protein n=1 Tax=Streblomastix strix TaxID=222440 RepID=A0A5J4VZQ7_9EUKA|nr:MAG: hypothetical protein EZS28_016585 [Streblomastix strix]